MVTRRIGYGMVVSTGDSAREAAVRPPVRRHTPGDFFAANGISPPSGLFDAIPGTFYFAKDVEGRFVWRNRLLQEQHGLPRGDDAIGKRDHDFLCTAAADRIRADDLAVMAGAAVIDNKLEAIEDRNGVLRWVCTTKTPLRNGRGDVIGIEGVSRAVADAQAEGEDSDAARE